MKTETIGAFEAKTRLSELLREVGAGRSFTITVRGAPVARLTPCVPEGGDEARQALARVREGRARYKVSAAEIRAWRDEGRRR